MAYVASGWDRVGQTRCELQDFLFGVGRRSEGLELRWMSDKPVKRLPTMRRGHPMSLTGLLAKD